MDPIAMGRTALEILNAYKKDLDKCAETYENAKQLRRLIDIFEVSVSMIPPRGPEAENLKSKSVALEAPNNNIRDNTAATSSPTPAQTANIFTSIRQLISFVLGFIVEHAAPQLLEIGSELKEALEAKEFDTDQFFDFIAEKADETFEESVSMILEGSGADEEKQPDPEKGSNNKAKQQPPGGCFTNSLCHYSLFCSADSSSKGADEKTKKKKPKEKKRPAEIMDLMRKKGYKDLEITFVGMAFIIQGALQVIQSAVSTVVQIEKPPLLWIIMPWKVFKQNKLGEAIEGHFESIHQYNTQLLNAISIASYAVNLESLENVLNASNMIANNELREFWRKKVGIDKTHITMGELASVFLEENKSKITENNKEKRLHFQERIVKRRVDPHVCLSRILNQLWNPNGDDWVTVYELNEVTKGKRNAIQSTLQEMLVIENAFYSSIKFSPLKVDVGEDGVANTADDHLEGVAKGKTVELDPYEPLIVLCTLPCFDPDIYAFDCISVLKYDRDPLKAKETTEFVLEELRDTRAYIIEDSNVEFYGEDFFNAPKVFKFPKDKEATQNPKAKGKIDGFRGNRNFERTKIDVASVEEDDALKDTVSLLTKGGIVHMKNILYTPVLMTPGFYTIRYCLDDLDWSEDHHVVGPKKLAQSPKSYYYDRSIEELQESGNKEISEKFLLISSQGIGFSHFKTYCELIDQALQLSIDEAKNKRDVSAINKYSKLKQKVKGAANIAKDEQQKRLKGNNGVQDTSGSHQAEHKSDGEAPVAGDVVQSATEVVSLVKNIRENYQNHFGTDGVTEKYLKRQCDEAVAAKAVVKEKVGTLKRLEISFQLLDLIVEVKKTEQKKLKSNTDKQWTQVDDAAWGKSPVTTNDKVGVSQTKVGNSNPEDQKKTSAEEEKEKEEKVPKMSPIFADVDACLKSLRSLHQLACILMPSELNLPEIRPPKIKIAEDLNVYDMNNGVSSQDVMVLKIPTLASYIHFKLGAIKVDAIEAISQGHVSRARLLDTERNNFTKKVLQTITKMDAGDSKNGSSTIKASLLVEQKKVLPAVIENRASLLVLADQLLKQLEKQLDNILGNSDMANDNAAKEAQSIVKIMEEVKYARKNAANTPPSGSMSSIVKRSLGFLVTVRDRNALAWAEEYVDQSKVAHANGGSGEAKLWRPLVDRCYPFGAIKNRVVETEPTTLNIFARVKKVKNQQAGERGKSAQEVEPKAVGVFRLSEPRGCIACQTISSEGETLSFDLSELLEGEYAICFVKPGTEAGPNKTAMCSESDPKLTLEFVKSEGNDRRDDGDSDGDGDYYDDYYDSDYYEDDDEEEDEEYCGSQSDHHTAEGLSDAELSDEGLPDAEEKDNRSGSDGDDIIQEGETRRSDVVESNEDGRGSVSIIVPDNDNNEETAARHRGSNKRSSSYHVKSEPKKQGFLRKTFGFIKGNKSG